jgi:hypothetical protein
MASRRFSCLIALLWLVSCSQNPVREPALKPFSLPETPRQIAEDVKFPAAGKKGVEVVETNLLGLPFLTGGNLAEYDTGKLQYKLFVIRMKSPAQAGSYIFELEKQLQGAKFVASYGGYFGQTSAGPLFVFAKGAYIGGIAGLTEDQSVQIGKEFAARL